MKYLTTFRVIDAIARTGSIRRAADHLALTPSAVQRRLQSYEEEIGYEIFDRGPQGVELNSAGELVIMHIRETFSETGKLTSRLADLSGMRRGEVRIGCSQALVPYFLPRHISSYQTTYPNVTFEVVVMEHRAAQSALASHVIDLALVFGAEEVPEFKTLLGVRQRLAAVMAPNHPLAHFEQLRLRQCYEHPVAMPGVGFGSRAMVDAALREKSYARQPELESNSFEYLKAHVAKTMAVTFQIESGAPLAPVQDTYLTARLIDIRDVSPGTLWMGQLPGRNLSVAASRFSEQVGRDLSERYQHV
ncbi:LysR family transcriptional regulator [Marivita sp. XM-24bin2]|uniref:LysR family transcriptional regulator n=1 Tax=Marivita sp. XM-24bin2 TaxID=2133951 RepID=UPI000D7B0AE9|nr:LysR family transcriptional regulator [Marivita sp. XM-24bin2]PWL33601.1 MAG: LysR family transcriptional regulator [Marivita sp. XM-24bin2]